MSSMDFLMHRHTYSEKSLSGDLRLKTMYRDGGCLRELQVVRKWLVQVV